MGALFEGIMQGREANAQDQATARDIYDQQGYQTKINSAINTDVAGRAASSSVPYQQQRLADYTKVLATGQPQIQAGIAQPGGTSSAYNNDASTAALGVNNYANKAAGLMSRMDAPQMQRQKENFADSDLAGSVGALARDAQGQHFVDQLKLRATKMNPWLQELFQASNAATSALVGGAI